MCTCVRTCVHTCVRTCVLLNYISIVTFPIDITKTRLQLQGERQAVKGVTSGSKVSLYRGMFHTAYGIGMCMCATVVMVTCGDLIF